MHPGMEGLDSDCEMSGGEEDTRSPSSCSLSSNKGSNTEDKASAKHTQASANGLTNSSGGSNPVTGMYDSLSPKPESSADLQRDLNTGMNTSVRGKTILKY